MPDILPPAPVDAPFTSYNWADWYKKVRDAINDGATVAWSTITGKPTTVSGLALTDLTSGTYTPTTTDITNVDSSSGYASQYLRVGGTVTVSGAVSINPTATGDTIVDITLPIASSFTNSENAAGVMSCSGIDQFGTIIANATDDQARLRFLATDTAARDWWFTFTYRVI